MIAIILWSIICLISIILISVIKVSIIYDSLVLNSPEIIIQILFFKFKVLGHNRCEKKNKTSSSKLNKKQKIYNDKYSIKENTKKNKKLKKHIIDIFKDFSYKDYIDLSIKILNSIKKLISIEEFKVNYIFTGNNFAEIGQKYAMYTILLNNVYLPIKKLLNIKNIKIRLWPNFVNQTSQFYFKSVLKLRLIIIVLVLFDILFKIYIVIYKKYKELKRINLHGKRKERCVNS